jgi:hypothetical protein
MASTQAWYEYNGATPTETAAGSMYWKSVDDNTGTTYTASPIPANGNSVEKIQALKFSNASGTTVNLSALSYTVTQNGNTALGTSPYWKIMVAVPASGTFFTQPAVGTPAAMGTRGGTTPVYFPTSGTTVAGSFGTVNQAFTTSTTGPFTTAGGASVALPTGQSVYATALYTQLQTGSSAAAGQIFGSAQYLTATWTES